MSRVPLIRRARPFQDARGMTLVEILVAMAIFSILGLTLALFLRQGLAAWRTAESRRGVYEEAQSLIRILREDLRATYAGAPATPGEPSRARLLCDIDEQGRTRLALVRTIPTESRHPLAGLAGNAVGADAELDGRDDHAEAIAGRLRATGGLMEVLWAVDPEEDGVLRRAARAPAGGEGSVFLLENVKDAGRLRALAHPISHRVLHFELAFWTQGTTRWDSPNPPSRAPHPGTVAGPAKVWDSTRATLPADPDASPEAFSFFRGEGSLGDDEDDIFPERVRGTLTIAEDGPTATWGMLSKPLGPTELEVQLVDARAFELKLGFVRIGKGASAEWVKVKSVDVAAGRLRLETDGRARRGTRGQLHPAGSDAATGRTFTFEVELPAYAEAWNE